MSSPRRLLGLIAGPLNAVHYVRFLQPFEHLREAGYTLVLPPDSLTLTRGPAGLTPDPSLLDGVDAIVFPQMVLSPTLPGGERVELVNPLCEHARRRGVRIVYSPDDYLEPIEPGNPSYETISDSANNVRLLLEHADALIVTTPHLARTLASWNRPIHVLPNAIDPARWSPRSRAGGSPRLGWSGSSSHIEDLLMVVPALRKLRRRKAFRFRILGLVDRPIKQVARETRALRRELTGSRRRRAELFCELAGELRSIEPEHHPFGRMEDHFDRLSALDLDLGICPLIDTSFNRHKSALKFYEYAACGTMTVASAVTPYREEVSVAVENDPDTWCDVLERYLFDPAAREAELQRQRDFVLRERNIRTLKHDWAQALETILSGAACAVP